MFHFNDIGFKCNLEHVENSQEKRVSMDQHSRGNDQRNNSLASFPRLFLSFWCKGIKQRIRGFQVNGFAGK